ncbi:MAG: dienelactone hydrolase family protein [Chloroflexota bacterium]|nr:dienelactone hydrolase family protein [Chloroflexota bacterium]
MGENVRFAANGGHADGYLAVPSSGRGAGVVVIQEWWGLNDQIQGVADMLAKEGFTALAPDFYAGKSASIGEPDQAGKLMMELQRADAAKVARGAAAYLLAQKVVSSKKVGAIGFCMGGGLALLTASVAPDSVGAVVDCYGVGPLKPKDVSGIRAPVLGIFGGKDHIEPEVIAALGRDLEAAGTTFDSHIYPEADHAFLNEQRKDVYRDADARDAWGKIIPFLRRHLG